MRSRRGFADPVTLYLIAGLAVGIFVGSWKPLAMFRKPPPTAQLTVLQAKLDAQKALADEAAKAAEAAKKAEREKLEAQVRAAQQDNLGTVTALKHIKPEAQTAETKLAARMAQRVSLKLAAAIGKLPAEDQEAMIELIQQALSEKQEEVEAANVKLATLDASFRDLTAKRNELVAQIPLLTEEARKSNARAIETALQVKAKTEEVKKWANKADEALRESGGLMDSVKKVAYFLIGGYLLLTVVLPGLIKHLSTDNPLKGLLRDASGYLTSPLLYHDARKKIPEALASEPPK